MRNAANQSVTQGRQARQPQRMRPAWRLCSWPSERPDSRLTRTSCGRLLRGAGFHTIWDLLQHVPRDYQDLDPSFPWTDLPLDLCVGGVVGSARVWSSFKGSSLQLDLHSVHTSSGEPLHPGGPPACRACSS